MGTKDCNDKESLKWEYNEEEKTLISNGKCLCSAATPEQTEVWAGGLSDGNKVILLLNRASVSADVEIKWNELGLSVSKAYLRDLWQHKYLGGFNDGYKINLASHESQLLKVYEEDPETPVTDTDSSDESDTVTPSDTDEKEKENDSENKTVILSLTVVSLVLLLAFIGFVVFYMLQKRKKVEDKNPNIDNENLDSNLIRESKSSTTA